MKIYENTFHLKVYIIIICILLIYFNISIANNAVESNDMKTEQEAIEIANIEIKKLGYDKKAMNIKVTFHETPYNDYLPKGNTSDYIIERRNKLKNKKYWAVYYYRASKEIGIIHKGGDICVFIDVFSGDIITNYRGK